MEENNRIIAEFMGIQPIKAISDNTGKTYYYYNNSEMEDYEALPEYHSDWNWLMAVVEKIESIKDSYHGRFGVYISSNSCTIQSTNFRPDKPIPNPPHYYNNVVLNNKIESVYYSIIYFINFYNKQKEE